MNLLALAPTLILLIPLLVFATPTPFSPNTTLVTPAGSSTKHDPFNQKPAHERRGIAYNDVHFAKFFDIEGTHVTWRYNWDSSSPPSDAWFRFIPMLHSLRDDHTGRWKDNSESIAGENWKRGEMATWMLGFNEPDNCM
jgi:hypothetical protein